MHSDADSWSLNHARPQRSRKFNNEGILGCDLAVFGGVNIIDLEFLGL